MTGEGRLVAGRYRLGQRIGSGAMGVVWQAHDERLHRTVAIKQLLLQPGLSAAEANEARQRAMREGRIAARLQHPNAIAVYDVAEADGQPWLVMEYLPSQSLAAVLSERGALPPHEAARIGAQAASALAAAHAAGIVHRDVKPGNVLLGHDGTVKITDFGISRATGDVQITATGMLAGTPAYLAPEVAKGYDPGPPSDVFSLGAMIYAAVEGEPPFGLNENTLALLHLVAAGKIIPPQQAGPLTPLLLRLLLATPTERPTMSQAREGLSAVAASQPIPPNILGGNTWLSMQPTVATASAAPTQALGPAGPAATRLDARPMHDIPSRTRIAGAAGHVGTRPPGSAAAHHEAEQQRHSSRRPMVLAGIGIVAAAVVGILFASAMAGNPSPASNTQTQAAPTQAPVIAPETTTKKPTTTPPTTTSTTTTSPTTTTQSLPTAQESQAAVIQYYGLVPKHLDQAWAMLSANMQAKFGSFDNYKRHWSNFDSVTIQAMQVSGNNVVLQLHYRRAGRLVGSEVTSLTLVKQGDKVLIDSETKIQALTSPSVPSVPSASGPPSAASPSDSTG